MTPNPSDPAPGEVLVEECRAFYKCACSGTGNIVRTCARCRALAAFVQKKVEEERERACRAVCSWCRYSTPVAGAHFVPNENLHYSCSAWAIRQGGAR